LIFLAYLNYIYEKINAMASSHLFQRSILTFTKKKYMRQHFLLLLCTFFLIVNPSCKKEEPDPVSATTEVQIVAILDLSGDYSEEGKNGKAAIELALSDLNAIYQLCQRGYIQAMDLYEM